MSVNKEIKRVAVDLTPILPGGENGGAKLMTIELVRNLGRVVNSCEFILLTSEQNHAELAFLDSVNVRRIVITGGRAKYARVKEGMRRMAKVLPARIRLRLGSLYSYIIRKSQGRSLLRDLEVDLLFCPFTAPFFYDPKIPLVSVVYDLQYRYYPQFFSSQERYHRDKHFMDASRFAKRLICISEYVRETVIKNTSMAAEHIHTAYIRLTSRVPVVSRQKREQILERVCLVPGRFLLFPANFWQHKNHQMLFTAFGMYLAEHSASDLKLACTGTPSPQMEYLQDAVRRMGLADRVVFPGYLSDEEYAVLLLSCKALIFPSLYEGFGMPIAEAMAAGKPVLCSNVTSLPEVGGDAAIYFDPKRPQTIVSAINHLEREPELVAQLIEQGRRQAAKFGDAEEMARDYWNVFQEAVECSHYADNLHGVYPDGWCSERVHITYQEGIQPRRLEIDLSLPSWYPAEGMTVTFTQKELNQPLSYRIEQGQMLTIRHDLSPKGGFIELLMDHPFQPKALGVAEDTRLLGCLCQGCRIVSGEGTIVLHEAGVVAT